jgi:hypothetical protein
MSSSSVKASTMDRMVEVACRVQQSANKDGEDRLVVVIVVVVV